MASKIRDLEETIKTWAWNVFMRTRTKAHSSLQFDDVRLEVNWSRVKFIPSSPAFSDKYFADIPQSKVVFKSTYVNLTESEQEHSFQTERTTVSCCTTTVSKGFSKGMHLELKLGLPDEVAGATAGFGREVNMESTDESTHEQSMTWSINSNIRVPKRRRMVAELVVQEKELNAMFKVTVQIKGMVIVTITNLKDNNSFVQSVEGDFAQIMKKNFQSQLENESVVIRDRQVTWEVEGKCHFRFGVEQHVRLTELPLTEEDLLQLP